MTVFTVVYTKKNMNKYFGGGYDYNETKIKVFSTKKKAEKFVASEEKEFVPTWNKETVIKEAGNGTITETEVE